MTSQQRVQRWSAQLDQTIIQFSTVLPTTRVKAKSCQERIIERVHRNILLHGAVGGIP